MKKILRYLKIEKFKGRDETGHTQHTKGSVNATAEIARLLFNHLSYLVLQLNF